MVFENVFANLLNTYLSGFIDDVSANQLKLGAWKGRLELTNLSVKENALDSLDLPFKITHGRVGVLSASIPWSSLYTSPVVFKMSNVLVVATPNVDSSFDPEKEEQAAEAAKQKLLASIEEGLRKAKEKELTRSDSKKKDDDFVTKLTAQIIKNVQIRIENIHVRFEDNFTDPLTPYVAGFTIGQIVFETQTLEDNSSPSKTLKYSEASSDDIIYKLVSLSHFSLYWNVVEIRDERDTFVSYLDLVEDREQMLLSAIARHDNPQPDGLHYLLKPITFSADAMINRKPHVDDFNVPVADVDITLNDFKVGFNRKQFESLLMLLDSLGRMKLAFPHRRWRPSVPLRGNASKWWNFAITAILENEVRRKTKKWTWSHIQSHRKKMREYLEVYREKLLKPKNKAITEKALALEKDLDVFNIILARKQAEASIASQLEQLEAERREKKKNKGGGWFSGWWGGGNDDDDDETDMSVIDDFKKEMTQEEKDKLYSAIGYGEESVQSSDFPKEFMAHLLSLSLQSITFVIVDDQKRQPIIEVSLQDCSTSLRHRPASNGIEVSFAVDDLVIWGMNGRPLVREETPEKAFEVDFISNPINGHYDFGLSIRTNPLHLIFDAPTINSLTDMFNKPSDVSLQQIQAMAEARISRLKKMSATGLEYAISKHKDMRLDIDCAPLYIIIPHGNMWEESDDGSTHKIRDAIIFCLGRMKLESLGSEAKKMLDVRQLSERETHDTIIQLAREKAYDSFKLSLSDVHVMLSSNQTWKEDIGFNKGKDYRIATHNSLLQPINLEILLQQCIISDDPDLPKFKVNAVIPRISIVASDVQLIRFLTTLMELPTPTKKPPERQEGFSDSISIGMTLDEPDSVITRETFKNLKRTSRDKNETDEGVGLDTSEVDNSQDQSEQTQQQLIDFAGVFEISEISCDLIVDSLSKSIMKVVIREIGASATKDTFTVHAKAHLGQVIVQTMAKDNEEIMLFETSESDLQKHLLFVEYSMIDKKSPHFENVLQRISLQVSEASCQIDHHAIGNIMAWSENITKHLPQKRLAEVSAEVRRSASSISSLGLVTKGKRKDKFRRRRKRMAKLVTLVLIEAKFNIEKISVSIRGVCTALLKHLNGSFTIFDSSRSSLSLEWGQFSVLNNVATSQPMVYSEIISSSSSDGVLRLSLTMFTPEEVSNELSDVDMSVSVTFGELKIIFLNEFVGHLLLFLNNFEEAKKRAVEATYAAAEAAKQSAISAYEKCTKIGLSVSLDAPKIIIPESWSSKEGVILDLGKINLSNSFKSKQKATLDFMQIKLSQAKVVVSKNLLDSQSFSPPSSLNVVLTPISFTLTVLRNLSFNQNKLFPEMDVSARLEGVHLKLSQFDLQLFMNIISNNLGQGPDTSQPTRSEEICPPSSTGQNVGNGPSLEQNQAIDRITALPRQPSIILEEVDVHVDAEEPPKPKPVKRLKFGFSVPDLTLSLFDGQKKDSSEQLCEAQLVAFETFGDMSTDNSLGANVVIANILLTDVREVASQNEISKLLYAKVNEVQDGDEEKKKMLRISLTMSPARDVYIDIDMKGFTLIFALDYLLRLSSVFVEGVAGTKEQTKTPKTTEQISGRATKSSSQLQSSQGQGSKSDAMTVVVKFQMSKVDIVLIESVVTTNCPAVIFNNILELDIKQRETQLSLVGKVAEIQLSMTNLRRFQETGEVEAYILQPCDLDFVGKIDSETNIKRLDVIMDELKLNISPNTVQALVSILSAIGSENKHTSQSDRSILEGIRPAHLLTPESIETTDEDHWFLTKNVAEAVEISEETEAVVLESPTTPSEVEEPVNRDQLMMKISSMTVVLETGGMSSHPILQMESSLTGRLDGWSQLESSVSLLMTYYNETLMAWEPVIEPVDGSGKRWCTELKAKINTSSDPNSSTPKITANIESHERFEVTISKSFMNVVTRLGEVFGKAVKKSEKLSKQTDTTLVTNHTGMDVMLIVNKQKFSFRREENVVSTPDGYSTIILYPDQKVNLERTHTLKSNDEESSDFIVRMILDDKEINRNIFLKTKIKRVYEIPVASYPSSKVRWLLSVDMPEFANKKVTIGTPVEVINNLQRTIDIFKYFPETEEAEKVSSIPANTSWFLPLSLVFSEPDIILISAGEDYCLPNQGIRFKSLDHVGRPILIKCEPKRDAIPAVNIQVVLSSYNVLFEDTNKKIAQCITIEVNPALVIQNLLPLPVHYTLPMCSEKILTPGQKHQLGQFDPQDGSLQLSLPDYWGQTWVCSKKIDIKDFDEDDVFVWNFTPLSSPDSNLEETTRSHLHLAMSLSKPFPSKPVICQIFAPFWLINKTGLKICLKSGDDVWNHPPDSSLPLFFSFKAGKLFKQKLQLQIEDSVWSDSFSIDAVGNQGNIICQSASSPKKSSRKSSSNKDDQSTAYCVSVDITLSSFSLTKVVTFSPFYSIVNRTEIFLEASGDKRNWRPVNPSSSVSFWPRVGHQGFFYLRVNDIPSCAISLKESNSSLIALGDDLFNVLVDVTDSGVKIQLSDYDEGSCPVRLFNATSHDIEYWQHREIPTSRQQQSTSGIVVQKRLLKSLHSVYYMWDEPSELRQLMWKPCNSTTETTVELIQDSLGRLENENLYWVSFLDGRQRVLMITPDSALATSALQAGEFTKPNTSLEVSMKGLGISIVNDEIQQDLLYLGISGSDTIWEVRKVKGKRFKPLPIKQIEVIEAAYQREVVRRKVAGHEGQVSPHPVTQSLSHRVKIDLTDLNRVIMLEPAKGILRRFSAPGFWAQVNISEHVLQTHAKIARIQVDNQMDNCLFNIIMCPVTPPKSLSSDRAPKAFIELSTVLQKTANLNRFKYLSVLIQEFLVQIDGSFLLSMAAFLDKNADDKRKETNFEKLIQKDMKLFTEAEDINDDSEVILSKAYYDLIHFSPIKVHVSFSLGGMSSFHVLGVLDLLMRSAGVTLTEFKDVTFKIDFFERKNVLLDSPQLISQATSHYIRQVLKQFYVIVLGLDVIGNPVGLVMGIKQGVGDLFYEPFLGIIEGPEEFAEGLALGVKSLFSHTVGGAAGALSRITGTIGEGVSALTMDDDFIRRRRMRMQRKQNVAESGKELAQGFWRGLTGIIRKPIEGARDEGVEGLLKGIGKGAVGVIAQPATGVIDFASGSLGALKKAVDINAEARKQRPPRFFQSDSILRPYNLHEATGHQILTNIDKGSYSTTDHYITHCVLKHPANVAREIVVLVTNVRVFVLKESCLFGTWDVEWKEDFSDVANIEIFNTSIVKFVLKEQRTKLCIINDGNERLLYCQSQEAAQWLLDKLLFAKSSSH